MNELNDFKKEKLCKMGKAKSFHQIIPQKYNKTLLSKSFVFHSVKLVTNTYDCHLTHYIKITRFLTSLNKKEMSAGYYY